MSENARKRSRKSKLVPRDCADIVEEEETLETVLQEPPQKKLLLEKIKKEPAEYVPQEPSAHQFSVNVEVEDIEDMDSSVPDEDPSSYMKYLFSLSKASEGTEQIKEFQFVDNSLLLEKKAAPEDEKNNIVDVKKVQKMLSVLHKKYPDEKEVVIHTRNQWGKVFSEKCTFVWWNSAQEGELQDVLKQWSTWSLISKLRESPLSYKCYVCDIAWWSYTEFRTHIAMHPNCKLDLEAQHQECNIIAYIGIRLTKDLHVHGKCLKCAKSYEHHRSNRTGSDAYYYCNYCQDRFQTCSSLTKHEGACNKNPIRVLYISQNGKEFTFSDFSCQVCGTVFLSQPDLTEHMIICHKVRSDEPITTKFKTCQLCKQKYYIFNFHSCLKKNVKYECQYCHSMFQKKEMLDSHLKMWADVVPCRICDKFISRSCMAWEHYTLHSENFQSVFRCLACKKIKVFVTEDALKGHKSRYHRRVDHRRPWWDRIIMAKLMLQQCLVNGNAKKTIPKILRKKAPLRPKRDRFKLTRGETMQQVRVYVPINASKNNKAKANTTKESQIINTTLAHDKIDSMRPKKSSDNIINIKQEKDSDIINEKEKSEDNAQVPESEHAENINNVIKTERCEDSSEVEKEHLKQGNHVEKEMESSIDLPKIREELNEFLDIKPDVVKIKEEKYSDDEDTQDNLSNLLIVTENDTDIAKVFQASSTFAEEVTENSEHSKVFQVSKSILESETVVKQEIKTEPEDKDLIILDSSSDSAKKDESISDTSEQSLLNLEPEVILQAGYRKRKIYRCSKCDFSGYHREYKQHINSHCQIKEFNRDNCEDEDLNYKCTKCNESFANMKTYTLHFEKHGYKYMSCPQCDTMFDSLTKLIPHVNFHIKNQFVRLQLFDDKVVAKIKKFQCKACKGIEDIKDSFVHWEKHLVLKQDKEQAPVQASQGGTNGDHALKDNVLKDVIATLTREEKSHSAASKRIKTCIVCARHFERRNDCKRHLVEHLLEDALANITVTTATSNMLKCQICNELHKKPDSYKKHMRDHASLPIYQCSLCDKTFSDSSNFTKHKKIHNLKAFVCDICSKKFQAKFSLVKHMEMHMTTDPITCELCKKVFHCPSFYKRHYRQHHDKLVSRYKCMFCREKYNTLREKWDHMWEVHKQRKDKADCPVCGRSYRKFADVKKHAQSEHGLQITLSNVWTLLGNVSKERDKELEQQLKEERDSDDDCLVIEEERETLVIYD